MISSSAQHQSYLVQSDLLIQLQGRVVLDDIERLKGSILPGVTPDLERVYIDLSSVDYIDSAGLGFLVHLKMASKKTGSSIVLLQPSRQVSDILYISKLDGIFEVLNGAEAQAVKSRMIVAGTAQAAAPAGAPAGVAAAERAGTSGGTGEWLQARLDTAFPSAEAAPAARTGGGSTQEAVEEHCRRAVDYMRQGNYEMSVEEYRSALALDPNYLPALNNLAIVYEKQPSWGALAMEQWEKVLELSRARGDQKHQDRASRHLANLRKMQG